MLTLFKPLVALIILTFFFSLSAKNTPSDENSSQNEMKAPVAGETICSNLNETCKTLAQFGLDDKTLDWIKNTGTILEASHIHLMNGSEEEYQTLLQKLLKTQTISKLNPILAPESYIARSDPRDVARIEDRTFICTQKLKDAGPTNNWMNPSEMKSRLIPLFNGSMKGRTLYIIPYCMGPLDSKYARFGIQLTDSSYVAASLRTLARVGNEVLKNAESKPFVCCLHSMGKPLRDQDAEDVSWPCDPENITIAHFPEAMEVWSFGSNYGGNALLNKKCLALRLASWMGKNEGWLAEHMLILSVTNPRGIKRYMAAAFPSACGKTNLAMLESELPGWKVEMVGDDIAWLHWADDGTLRAINPEYGIFGVAPGTNYKTNPNAMKAISSHTLFTNVAVTDEKDVWWEGKSEHVPCNLLSWENRLWNSMSNFKAAHPNARYCTPLSNCPNLDPSWNDPNGVPISAIIFGGRRSTTIPLVREAFSWDHGVFFGATVSSETTAAAAGLVGKLRHDPFAMLPFCGYNMGNYFSHWINFKSKPNASQYPRFYAVNWFKKNRNGRFIWPGYCHNIHVLKWIFERCEGQADGIRTEIGIVPTKSSIDLGRIEGINGTYEELFLMNRSEWKNEIADIEKYMSTFGTYLPQELIDQTDELKSHICD